MNGTNNGGRGYYLGDIVEALVKFVSPRTGLPIDPASVEATFTEPDGTDTTYEYGTAAADNADRLMLDDEGVFNDDAELDVVPWYAFRYTPTQTGDGKYKIQATGEGAAVMVVRYSVRAT
jgi:hypothetical protein